jgi:hypothetical protein
MLTSFYSSHPRAVLMVEVTEIANGEWNLPVSNPQCNQAVGAQFGLKAHCLA